VCNAPYNVCMMNATRDRRTPSLVIGLDLSRPHGAIRTDLRRLFPNEAGIRWKLDAGRERGWVYNGSDFVLARLVQS